MKAQNVGFTYKPKIPAVKAGTCRQTVRMGRRFELDQVLHLFTWEGKPRHSKWGWRKDERCVQLYDVSITPGGILCATIIDDVKPICNFSVAGNFYPWETLDWIAKRDGIEPPTGKAMGELFRKMHKLTGAGSPAQIVRW